MPKKKKKKVIKAILLQSLYAYVL